MGCPRCTDQPLDLTSRADIEVDICPRCRGVWLDRGEIDRLMARIETGAPLGPSPDAPRPSGGQAAGDVNGPVDDDRSGKAHRDDDDDDDHDDDDDDREDRRGRSEREGKRRASKKRKGRLHQLGEILEEIFDL